MFDAYYKLEVMLDSSVWLDKYAPNEETYIDPAWLSERDFSQEEKNVLWLLYSSYYLPKSGAGYAGNAGYDNNVQLGTGTSVQLGTGTSSKCFGA